MNSFVFGTINTYGMLHFDVVCCACGTGATMAGIALSLKEGQSAIGFQVLKAEGYIENEVKQWLKHFEGGKESWSINENYHLGGYARISPELAAFVDEFKRNNNIQLDYIYTGKMMFGIYDLIKKGFFTKGQRIIAIHTGGLRGNAGFSDL